MKLITASPSYYNDTFPNELCHRAMIKREVELEEITQLLQENSVVSVCGDHGVGVTTLLTMFISQHIQNTISYFFDEFRIESYSSFFMEQCLLRQVYYMIHGFCLPENLDVNLASIRTEFLQKIRQIKPVYLIIDGLENVPVEYQDDVIRVLAKLPLAQLKVLIVGSGKNLKWCDCLEPANASNKLRRFTKDAVREYVKKNLQNITEEELDVVCRISGCVGYKVRHLIDISVDKNGLDDIKADENLLTKNIFYYVDELLLHSQLYVRLFCALIYAKFRLTVSMLTRILEVDDATIDEIVTDTKLILSRQGDIITFNDTQVKEYLFDKLRAYRVKTEFAVIKLIESDSQYQSGLLDLYKNVNQKQSIINLLQLDTFHETLDQAMSQTGVNVQCEYGYKASTELLDAIRFAVLKSTSLEIEKNELWDYEIEALVLDGKVAEAFALAHNVFLKEEQLKAWAIIARYKALLTTTQYQEVSDSIKYLISDIEFEKIPEKSVELAKLLLPIDINEAMAIVDRVVMNQKSQFSADKLYAMLTLSVAEDVTDAGKSDRTNVEDIREKIKDDGLKNLADAMRLVLQESSTENLIEKMENLTTCSQRIYILQFWIPEHRDHLGIEKVVEYAIQQVIADSSMEMPKACVMSEICKALPYIQDESMLNYILSQLGAIEESVKYPTENYVKIKIMQIEAVSNFDTAKSVDMLVDLYLYVEDLKNIGTRINSLSYILSEYDKYAKDKKILQEKAFTETQLLNVIKDIIKNEYQETAYHLRLIQKSIEYLVCGYHSFIFDITTDINTEERRSKAFTKAAIEYIRQTPIEKIDWDYLHKIISSIKIVKEFHARPYFYIARKFSKLETLNGNEEVLKQIKTLLPAIDKLYDEEDKCLILSDLILGLDRLSPTDSFLTRCSDLLYKVWGGIHDTQKKLELGFRLYKRLNKCRNLVGDKILGDSLLLQGESVLSTSSSAIACGLSLDLYVRSIVNLIGAKECKDENLSELSEVLSRLDDAGEAMVVWSRVVMAYDVAGDVKAKDIFKKYVLPHLSLAKEKTRYSHYVMYHIAPALFFYSDDLFVKQIEDQPEYLKNACINHVCGYIFQRSPYIENMENDATFFVEFDNMMKLVKLLRLSTEDDVIYANVDTICQSIIQRKNKSLSTEQRKSILQDLENIVNNVLPTRMGIQHDGYKLACLIAIKSAMSMLNDRTSIENLKKDIDAIPNKADQAFLNFIAAQYLTRDADKRMMIDRGIDNSKEIPYGYDKYERFSICLSSCNQISIALLKQKFDIFVKDIHGDKDSDYDYGEKVIDLAYQYDETLANTYVEMCDRDPGRQYNKNALHRCLERKKMLKSAEKDFTKIDSMTVSEYVDFFEKRYRSVHHGRAIEISRDKMNPVVESVFHNPLSASVNAINYLMSLPSSMTSVASIKLYKSMYTNMKLALSLSVVSKKDLEKVQRRVHIIAKDDTLIDPGEDERGKEMIINWYKKHLYKELAIIDPYFGLCDLVYIKRFLDINNDVKISILTHAPKIEDMETFRTEWNRRFDDMTSTITIKKVVYKDKPDDGPLHDRHWIGFDNRQSEKEGLQSNSASGIGVHMSTITQMSQDTIDSVWTREMEDLFYYTENSIGGRRLKYDTITIY